MLLTFITVNTRFLLLSCLAQPMATFMCGSCVTDLGDALKAYLCASSLNVNWHKMHRRKVASETERKYGVSKGCKRKSCINKDPLVSLLKQIPRI